MNCSIGYFNQYVDWSDVGPVINKNDHCLMRINKMDLSIMNPVFY